jgi:hypothetical protein
MVYTVSSTKLGLPLVCPKTPSQKKKKKKGGGERDRGGGKMLVLCEQDMIEYFFLFWGVFWRELGFELTC